MSTHAPLGTDAALRSAWRSRDTLLIPAPNVPDDADEPWALCLLDLSPPSPRRYANAAVRASETRAGRRTVRQRLRSWLPRADWRGLV